MGKTHLAIALAREAIPAGYTALFVSAPALVASFARAHAEGHWEKRISHFATPKLLVVDELGDLPFEPNAVHLFFPLVLRRCERGSRRTTSNRNVSGWGMVFGDALVATAILDRLKEKRRAKLLLHRLSPLPQLLRKLHRGAILHVAKGSIPDVA